MSFFTILLLSTAPGVAGQVYPAGGPPAIIDSYPTQSATIAANYACAGGTVDLRVEEAKSGIRVLSLAAFGKVIPPYALSQWNKWLEGLSGLRTVQVECTDQGAVVFINAAKPLAPVQTLVVAWSPLGLTKMSP